MLNFPNGDSIHLPPGHTSLTEELAKFKRAHTHDDPEIRYMLTPGIFDIATRYHNGSNIPPDRWARIHVERDDYLVIPTGRVHRFFGDERKGIEVIRLFNNLETKPVWEPKYTKENTPTGR